MTNRVRTAVFPVAGLGTRVLPASKAIPKEMLPIVDKPLIQYAVEEALAAGIERLVFVTSRGKSAIEDHFDFSPELTETLRRKEKVKELAEVEVTQLPTGAAIFVRQPEALGLGHAVWCARAAVGNEPFAVLLPDDFILADRPCLLQMQDRYEADGRAMLAIMEVAREHTHRYGIIDPGEEHDGKIAVQGLVEKPEPEMAPSHFAVIGRYILPPTIFALLETVQKGAGGEIQLTDALAALLAEARIDGVRFQGQRFDCGDKLGLFEANLAAGLRHPALGDGARAILSSYSGKRMDSLL